MDFEEMTKEQLIQIIKSLQEDCLYFANKFNNFTEKLRKVIDEN